MLRARLAVLKTHDFYLFLILLLLFGICTLVYYFGELVDFAGWEALRWEFFYGVHDIQRLLFLVPIIYAGYFFRIKGGVIVTITSLVVFLPRAIIISPFPEPILRAVLFTLIAGVIGFLTGMMRNELEQHSHVEALVRNENDTLLTRRDGNKDEVFTVGDLEVDLSQRLVKRHGQIVKLTGTEYKLLAYMVSNKGKLLTHKELLHNVWGTEYGKEKEYIRLFIWQLRRKIEKDPSNPQLIVNEPGIGYRFVAPE